MTCKEYDKINREFETAIAMMETLKRYDQRITNVLWNINPTEEKEKLLKAYRLFKENNTRGKK